MEPITKMLRGSVLVLLALVAPAVSCAHQLDEYVQATLVEIDPAAIRLHINLTPGVEVADDVLGMIDRDGDDVISEDEAITYAKAVKQDLIVRLDGRAVELNVAAAKASEPSDLRAGRGILQVEFALPPTTLAAGPHKLTFENHHFPLIGVYSFNAARPQSKLVRIISQNRNDDQSRGEIEFAYDPPSDAAKTGMVVLVTVLVVAALAVMVRIAKASRDERPI